MTKMMKFQLSNVLLQLSLVAVAVAVVVVVSACVQSVVHVPVLEM
jgi:hypothetical protein